MAAFDTNVLVRSLVGDDAAQTKKAERALAHHVNEPGGVYVSLVVFAEIAWVLGTTYGWDRAAIHDRLAHLAGSRGVQVEDVDLVSVALERYRVGKAQLADYIILGKAEGVGAELFTFDKRLARENGVTLL